jgi:hypothetical protein
MSLLRVKRTLRQAAGLVSSLDRLGLVMFSGGALAARLAAANAPFFQTLSLVVRSGPDNRVAIALLRPPPCASACESGSVDCF